MASQPRIGRLCILSFAFVVTACGNSDPLGFKARDKAACAEGAFCAGAASRIVTPTQEYIDGVIEMRFMALPHTQKFNLGGFGINPTQNLPDPIPGPAEALTQPAQERVYVNREGREEDLSVRVLVLDGPDSSGAQRRIALITLDAIGAGNIIQEKVMAAANEASCAAGLCIEPADVVFGQTHSHAGPDLQGLWGGVPQDWVENRLLAGVREAITEAVSELQPTEMTVAQIELPDFNNYRRPRVDPQARTEETASLLRLTSATGGAVVASLLQYSAHPTSINEDPRIAHPDYILGLTESLERDGGVGLFFNGPIADASGSGGICETLAEPNAYERVRCRGEDLAAATRAAVPRKLMPTLDVRHVTASLPVTNPAFLAAGLIGSFNRYYSFYPKQVRDIPVLGPAIDTTAFEIGQLAPVADTFVSRITLGGTQGVEMVTIPGEATSTFGRWIKSLADPAAQVMLFGLTRNSFGYIIPEEEFSYVDPSGDAGFTVPFTGYEEFVSMGPLTAPLLRLQAYLPLFDKTASELPPYLASCADPMAENCLINLTAQKVDYIQRAYAQQCLGAGAPEALCAMINPDTPLAGPCRDAGLPEGVCSAFGSADEAPAGLEEQLQLPVLDALLRGCDVLDASTCLLPFPNNHFLAAAPAGSPQSVERGGTGLRVNFNPLSTPRNAYGRPIDVSEWNRQDGYSPGQMIVTYVPGLGTVKDASGNAFGPVVGAPPLSDLSQVFAPDSSVLVLEVPDNAVEIPQRHLVWAEIDLNAGALLPNQGVPGVLPARPALLVRPAKNFKEGRRYVVVLRNLVDDAGAAIAAGAAFTACRDQAAPILPTIPERCAQLESDVFPVLAAAGVARDASLYLAWDFTVASSESMVSRLRHIRDDAFTRVLGQQEDAEGRITDLGDVPTFTITGIVENPTEELARRVFGVMTVPSYVVPADPSPLDADEDFAALLRAYDEQVPDALQPVREQCNQLDPTGLACDAFSPTDVLELAGTLSLPPNRFYYDPTDGANPADPQSLLYGDGLPDQNGTLTTRFTCNIPRSALSGKDFETASAADVKPARSSLYGHGLLGSRGEINQDQIRLFGNEHNVVFCAADWFGFATGDVANVVLSLADLSFFPVVPDGSQQGMLNQLFLARLLRHPQGLAADPNFQVGGATVIADLGEVFYDGNSQGGILGGVVVAASKDIQRGTLGVIGMNYSTLLTRSVDFALYSVPMYLSYQEDLDRSLVFSLIQMMWDRSENNGYANHITDNRHFRGPDNEVMLIPAFADHQVTMWSADVMARTVGATVDRSRILSERHPDNDEYYALEPVDYANVTHQAGSLLVPWDAPWGSSRCMEQTTPIPPLGNIPPDQGDDPHECPRREKVSRCQKSNFLSVTGRLVPVPRSDRDSSGFNCP